MIYTNQIIQQLCLYGIHLWPEEESIAYDGPEHWLTDDLLMLLKAHKALLLNSLQSARTIPLSYGQQGLWTIQQQEPDNSAYTVSVALAVHGQLNRTLLRTVIQLLVNRHESLRTRFVWQNEQVVQQILGYQPATIEEIPAVGWSDAERDEQLRVLHERPFDLAQGPLFRTTILQHSPEQHTILLSVHHIVVDGWSIYQLIDELLTFYRDLQAGQPVDLPIITQTYADYVAWQCDMIQRDEARLWAFWQEQLQGELPVLQLPTDHPRPAIRSLRGISHPVQIPIALTTRLKELAKQQQCTLYTLLLTAYQLLLARHTGQEEILVSLATAGRSRRSFDEVVGYLTSPVVLRTLLRPDQTFAELLAAVKVRTLAVMDHQDYPFARLVEQLNPPRDPSRTPIAQSSFVLQRSHRSQEQFQASEGSTVANLQVRTIPLPLFAGQEDIALELMETEEGLHGDLKGSADLFTPATLERI